PLRDLRAKCVEGRRRCRPSRAWFLNLLRHNAALLFAPLGRLATGRMRERGTQAVETASHTLLGRLRIPRPPSLLLAAGLSAPATRWFQYRTVGEHVAGDPASQRFSRTLAERKSATMKRWPPTRR